MEDQEPQIVQPQTTGKPQAKRSKAPIVILIIIIVLLLAAGAGAYWWRNDQADKQRTADAAKITELQSKIDALTVSPDAQTPTNGDTTTPASTPAAVPTPAVKENVIASITSGNTAALEGYMASSVHVVIAASSGVFDRTPAMAVTDLQYLDSATDPWNFALSTATLTAYGTGHYKDYFKSNSVVGKSADGKVVSFNFNDAGKINGVFMSASADLL